MPLRNISTVFEQTSVKGNNIDKTGIVQAYWYLRLFMLAGLLTAGLTMGVLADNNNQPPAFPEGQMEPGQGPAPFDNGEAPSGEAPFDLGEAPSGEAPADLREAPSGEAPADMGKAPSGEAPADMINVEKVQQAIDALDDGTVKSTLNELLENYRTALEEEKAAREAMGKPEGKPEDNENIDTSGIDAIISAKDALVSALEDAGIEI